MTYLNQVALKNGCLYGMKCILTKHNKKALKKSTQKTQIFSVGRKKKPPKLLTRQPQGKMHLRRPRLGGEKKAEEYEKWIKQKLQLHSESNFCIKTTNGSDKKYIFSTKRTKNYLQNTHTRGWIKCGTHHQPSNRKRREREKSTPRNATTKKRATKCKKKDM